MHLFVRSYEMYTRWACGSVSEVRPYDLVDTSRTYLKQPDHLRAAVLTVSN